MKLITVTPRATEKAYRLINDQNTYIFDVPLAANKNEIVAAIEAANDGVRVASIKTVVQAGKSVRFSRGKRRNPGMTTRRDTKKAYVTLREGKIRVFDETEQTNAKEETK